MATTSVNYVANTALTITLASLASDTTQLVGVESNQVNNTSTKYLDALLEGFITVGTTPTTAKQIMIYVWGSNVSLATVAKDTLVGTNSARTLTSLGVSYGILKLAQALVVDSATSNRVYAFDPISVASTLNLPALPAFWGVFVTQNTGVALNATAGNQALSFTGIKYDTV